MRRVALSVVMVLFCLISLAQVPESFNYQAIPRNASGGTYADQLMRVRISILPNTPADAPVYVETFNPTTTSLGLINLQIGLGTPETGTFGSILWGSAPFFMKVEIDPAGGTSYTDMGTTQLLSVPYSLFSKSAQTADYNTLTNLPVLNLANWNTAYGWGDHAGLYLDAAWVPGWTQITGIPTTLAGFGITDAINTSHVVNNITATDITNWNNKLETEVDGSVTNEIQSLSILNNIISLSDGGSVQLPATEWSLTGNAGTVASTDFIGTTDNVPLNFRVNNQKAGKISPASGNTTFGYQAGNSMTTAISTTAFGFNSLLLNSSGNNNTAIGNNTLKSNTTGGQNTAAGDEVLNKNSTGIGNTGVGYASLAENTTGYFNTALGYDALLYNNTGMYNSALGSWALHFNKIGERNTAAGYCALMKNVSGFNNTGLGNDAGFSNVSGSNNVFLGFKAGYNELGSNKLYIANNETTPIISGDFTTNKVGIGKASPLYALDIQGTGSDATIQIRGGAGSNGRIFLADGDVTHGITTFGPTDVFGSLTSNSDYGGFAIMGISEAANVGGIELYGIIGNADPSDIISAVEISGHKKNLTGIQSLGPSETIFGVRNGYGTNSLVIMGSGNVGIGTTTPSSSLDVAGDINFTGNITKSGTALTIDWTNVSGKPVFATVATSADYNDLTNKPLTDGSETKVSSGTNVTVTGAGTTASPYVINSTGYYLGQEKDGGIIYHIYRGSDGMEHGLIVSLTETTAQWQSTVSLVSANRSWDGIYNTDLMINSLAKDFVTGLGAGWYLPSIDELDILYHNRFYVNKVLFSGGNTLLSNFADYWSSTEHDAGVAWPFDFMLGKVSGNNAKLNSHRVRAVRAF